MAAPVAGRRAAPLPAGGDFADLGAIAGRWEDVETGRFEYLDGLADRDLDRDVRYVSVTRHVEERFPLWQTMLHITNHTTHHRADVSTALSRLGRAPESVVLMTTFAPTCDSVSHAIRSRYAPKTFLTSSPTRTTSADPADTSRSAHGSILLRGTPLSDRRRDQHFVTSGLRLSGGSVRALGSPLSVAAPCSPVDRWLFKRPDEHRGRAAGRSSPVDGPAPGTKAASSPSRPGVHRRHQQGRSSCSVVVVPGLPADAPTVAPGAREAEVDLPTEIDGR